MKRLFGWGTVLAVFLSFSPPAASQAYPSRTITMVVPFPAGGSTDAIGRILSEHMQVSLGQSIVFENVDAYRAE